jgi:ferritin-like metal-binding protein YciE
MAMESLHDLLVHSLKDLYSAEKQLVKALPRMAKAVEDPQLKRAFEQHLRETEGHVTRLERLGEEMGIAVRGKKCVGMEGLIEEGKELLAEDAETDVLEAALIGAAQKVEHYEMATYGTARAHAEQLGLTGAARLLQQTLDEESAANEKLTQIAESRVNRQARARAGNGQRQMQR